jgi:hypothetical protein
MNKAWSWKVKESELLWKNVLLPLTIPYIVISWGKLLLYAFCVVSVLRYCHNPWIQQETPKDELIFPSVFVVRVRAHELNLRMVRVWI